MYEKSIFQRIVVAVLLLCSTFTPYQRGYAEDDPEKGSLNHPDRLEWFRDQGFGLFVHWSVDSQLGVVISHSLVGASPEYTDRFFQELPKSFDPYAFRPLDWARLAHLAGVRYMMFTTKHHSGFAMFDTETTPFNIMNTPFHRDVTKEVFDAFRSEGIATGVYYSPDDFWWLHQHGKLIRRAVPDVQPRNNPGLMEYDQTQLRELLTRYGKVGRPLPGRRSSRPARSGMEDRSGDHRYPRGDQDTRVDCARNADAGCLGNLYDYGNGLAISAAERTLQVWRRVDSSPGSDPG